MRRVDDAAGHVESDLDAVAGLPFARQFGVGARRDFLRLSVHFDDGIRAPGGNAQFQGEFFFLFGRDFDDHVAGQREIRFEGEFQRAFTGRRHVDFARIVQIDDRPPIVFHDGYVRNVGQSHRTVEVATGDVKIAEMPAPAVIDDLVAVQQIHVTEPVARRFHRPEQAVIDVFFDLVHGRGIAGQAHDLGAEFQPGYPHAGLHHAGDVGVGLFESGVSPRLPGYVGVVGLIGPGVADDGDFVFPDVVVQIHECLFAALVARCPVVFYDPFEHRHHFVRLGVMAAHLVRESVVAGLLDQIEMLGSARFDDVRGEVQVPLLAGPVVQPHEGFQQRAGFDVARFVADVGGAPAQIDDFRFGRVSYLRDEAVGVFFQRLQYGGVLFDPAIVFIQSEHDVLALP